MTPDEKSACSNSASEMEAKFKFELWGSLQLISSFVDVYLWEGAVLFCHKHCHSIPSLMTPPIKTVLVCHRSCVCLVFALHNICILYNDVNPGRDWNRDLLRSWALTELKYLLLVFGILTTTPTSMVHVVYDVSMRRTCEHKIWEWLTANWRLCGHNKLIICSYKFIYKLYKISYKFGFVWTL